MLMACYELMKLDIGKEVAKNNKKENPRADTSGINIG